MTSPRTATDCRTRARIYAEAAKKASALGLRVRLAKRAAELNHLADTWERIEAQARPSSNKLDTRAIVK